jgi:2-oxoglutarate dehydrogenase E1 component
MDRFSYVGNADPQVLEEYYQKYLEDPSSMDNGWRKFFEGFDFARSAFGETVVPEILQKEWKVLSLISAYRQRGHLFTKTNPVRERRKYDEPLVLENYGLSDADLDTIFQAGNEVGLGPATLRDILELLDQTYCHSIGVEYKYIRTPRIMDWLQHRMESGRNTRIYTREEKRYILRKLIQAVVFEKFMHSRFVGQKRFSLEGVESVIPAMDAIVESGAEKGIEEFVIGMAHRGRLNLLANVLDKPCENVFREFEGHATSDADFAGDVKYHLGWSTDKLTSSGRRVHLSLCPNPSHLEAVDPVVEGMVRAKSDHKYSGDLRKLAPILIHGDASVAAQGVVYEVLQMSLLDGYKTGGTIHIVLNNQVGFTTNYIDGRSSTYCTDVGKVTLSPVFHVNGDDVEAVVYTVGLALEFRQEFQRDVFIDILGYRKWGHNEGDEPRFTQPKLYKIIASHPNPAEIYASKLVESGDVTTDEVKKLESDVRLAVQERLDIAKQTPDAPTYSFMERTWKGFRSATDEDFNESPETGVDTDRLLALGRNITMLPDGPKFFDKVKKIFAEGRRMVDETRIFGWALGEHLAYATLLDEGYPVRISGQDSERGTFSHRHAVVTVEDSEIEYVPLRHVSPQQAPFWIYNSLLSEFGVLGFEYGYAMAAPKALTIWEAQFGDFVNEAQAIIDQYVASGEIKWKVMDGVTMYLPHGYEGQGPEHSSGRMERFLTLCADNNLQVVNCTTPAQLFHVLRRQMLRPFRKPLVVFTPKSLLRHPLCVSRLEEFGPGTRFGEVLDDPVDDPHAIQRVLLCCGKIYYDLLQRKVDQHRNDVAIVRIEQLYPLPIEQWQTLTAKYHEAGRWLWVQEEPENMGALTFMIRKFPRPLEGISRKESATTATGFSAQHELEQKQILDRAFA